MDAGAHYFKTDLQVHTPRDPAWSGKRPITNDERKDYARDFVAACRDAGLQAVAITDHHDFVLLEYIRDATKDEKKEDGTQLPPERQLVVFPGLELTLAVPCQALLILDADFPAQRLSTVLEILAIDPTDPSQPKHAEPVQLPFQDLTELHERLDQNTWLQGCYSVLPNVTENGHGTLMRQGMQKKYRDMPCVGGYVDGDASEIGQGNTEKFAGFNKTWGNKRIAIIQTSDSRSAKYDQLGKHATWIKWAAPTAEALRQACLAQESRIAITEPQLPPVVLTRLRVTNSKFMGPVELGLNPQYNALIGGRGTGKSTILEYLRWALCDQPPESSIDDEMPDYAARRARLVRQTLEPFDSQVEVHFLLNGIPHVVRRYAASGDVMLKVGAKELAPASTDDIRSLLPIEAYGQRQLSTVGVRLEELTRFVTRPINDQLDQIAVRETDIASAIRENYVQLQRHRSVSAAITKDTFATESLAQQTEKLRESLTGLSDDDRDTLRKKPLYDEAEQLVSTWQRRIAQSESETEHFSAAVIQALGDVAKTVPDDMPDRQALLDLADETSAALGNALAGAESARDALNTYTAPGSRATALTKQWRAAHETYLTQYNAAAERSTAHQSKLKELREIEQRLGELQASLTVNRDELQTLGDPATKHSELRAHWREIQAERSQIIEQQCTAVTEISEGLIQASLQRGAGVERLQEAFKSAVTGSGLRTTKIEGMLDAIVEAADPLIAWHEALDELEQVVVQAADGSVATGQFSSALKVLSAADVQRLPQALTLEKILELTLLALDDHPIFRYRTKEEEYIAFKDASAGQQATALLRLLLKHDGPPLVIDQPEDDLDSQAIMEVVDQIWDAKRKRQLVFASHNANLVVNGDAELVVCCDYRAAGDHSAGRIRIEGAIDIPAVRNEITVVMEGGEKAFRLRKEKYGF